jgi:hypothetical protein
MTPSKSAMNFNGNNDSEPLHGVNSGGSMSQSTTHDERLHFGGEQADEKKDLGKK